MSWSAWIRASSNPADDGNIIAKSNTNSGWQFKTTPDTGPQTFGIQVTGATGVFTQRYSNTVRLLNVWYHVAAVYNSTSQTLDIYVNGVLDNGTLRGVVPTSQVIPAVNVNIGRRSDGFNFAGTIDNVRIYNRALSAAEIVTDRDTPITCGGPTPTATPTPTPTVTPTATPTPTPTLTPTPTPTATPTPISISGNIVYCSNPALDPVPNVTLLVTGSATGSANTDSSGNYTITGLPSGGSFVVTPSKASLTPGGSGQRINTVDIIAIQRHFLQLTLLTGCRLTAADVNQDAFVNTVDLVAIQRFFLGMTTGIANTGQYRFSPTSRPYNAITTNQTAQNYDSLVYGDVVTPFVERPAGQSQDAAGNDSNSNEIASKVAMVALPNVAVNPASSRFIAEVTTTAIDPNDNVVGFQGDFSFDSTLISFESDPVQKAGLTSGNWNVTGNVLDGPGPIRTLRISAFSNDARPLSGAGTLFQLRISRLSKTTSVTQLLWATPPDHFVFIDGELHTLKPGYSAPGSVTPSWAQPESEHPVDLPDETTTNNQEEEAAPEQNSANQ